MTSPIRAELITNENGPNSYAFAVELPDLGVFNIVVTPAPMPVSRPTTMFGVTPPPPPDA